MADEKNPEGQDWQRPCIRCGKVTVPKVEKVAEWLRRAAPEAHTFLGMMAHEDPRGSRWRTQAARMDGYLETLLGGWACLLEGVCDDCQPEAYPEVHERLSDPEEVNFDGWKRWAFSVPPQQDAAILKACREEVLADVEAFNAAGAAIAQALRPPATVRIVTAKGPKEVPCAFLRGGLAVTLTGEAGLEKARAEVKAGNADAYPAQAWAVTHIESGLQVCGTYDTAEIAMGAARRLLPLANWTLPMDALKASMPKDSEAWREVRMEKMRCNLT